MKKGSSCRGNKAAGVDEISQALSAIYTGIFSIDLANDRYEVIQAPEVIRAMIDGVSSAQQAMNVAIRKTVVEDEVFAILAFVDLKTLPMRMEGEKSVNVEYKGNSYGWVRGSFIELKRDEKGTLIKVLYVCQAVNDEKTRELDLQQAERRSHALSEKENQEKRQSLEADNKILTDEKLALTNERNALTDRNTILTNEKNALTDRNTILTNEKNELTDRNNALTDRNTILTNEKNELTDRNNALTDRNTILTNEKNELTDRNNALTDRNTILTNEKNELTDRNNALTDRNTILTNEKNELTDRNNALTDRNTILTNEKNALTDRNTILTNEKNALTDQNNALTDRNTVLTNEKNALTDVNTVLTNENEELQQARDAVHALLNSGTYISTYDRNGKLLAIRYSEALRLLYGYTDETDAPDTWEMWEKSIHPDDREYVESCYHKALEDYTGNTSYDVVYRALKKDGEIRWHRAAGYVIRREDGSPSTCYGLILDIDEQKKASDKIDEALNQARMANAAKTSFLARMSHDIRTPLNGIQGLIEINEKHANDIKFTARNRGKAKIAADHLLSLINDVLQLSKMEDPEIQLSKEPFDLLKMCDDIITIIEMRANENGIEVRREDDPSIYEYPYIWGSPLHVRQIFINILSNSVKYNKKNGTIRCQSSAEKIEDGKILFRAIISDSGIGMSEEFLQHLFDPFAREHEEMTSEYEGTGLGMAIVKQLVDKMGGKIQVESKVNVGSRFYIELPFELASKSDVEKLEEENKAGDITGKSILLVEDNDLNLEIAKTLLTDAGAIVTEALNGQQAVEIFQKNQPGKFDVILMDIMMPVMNGYEATKKIRSLKRADAQEIPVIAMTANAFAEDVEKARAAGMNDHISKPLDIQKMLSLIAKYSK